MLGTVADREKGAGVTLDGEFTKDCSNALFRETADLNPVSKRMCLVVRDIILTRLNNNRPGWSELDIDNDETQPSRFDNWPTSGKHPA